MNKRGLVSNFNNANKKGQITIFIIIALVIVGVALIVYFVVPKIERTPSFDTKNPNAFIETCLKDTIKDTVETVSLQGGSMNPEHYLTYNEDKIEYLCYTNENYKLCVVQQPLLKQHIESEIKTEIESEVTSCFNSLKESYEGKGYNVEMQTEQTKIELLPKRVVSTFDYTLTASKSGETSRYDSFSVVLNNNLYELTSIANSIIEWEATYGDAETTAYMALYKDLKVEKKNQQDGSTIYIIADRNTGNRFQFASRSVAWPSGFGEVPVFGG